MSRWFTSDAANLFQNKVCPLASLVSRKVDFLKIDVDGYELLVVQGARELISRDRPAMLLEFHPTLIQRHGGWFAKVMDFCVSIIQPSSSSTCRKWNRPGEKLRCDTSAKTRSEESTSLEFRKINSTSAACMERSGSSVTLNGTV